MAQECYSLADVQAILAEQSVSYAMIDPAVIGEFVAGIEASTGIDLPDGATNVLIGDLNGGTVIGLEIDGCMTPPIAIGPVKPAGLLI